MYILDAREGATARLEPAGDHDPREGRETVLTVPAAWLPQGIREGQVLSVAVDHQEVPEGGRTAVVTFLHGAREMAREEELRRENRVRLDRLRRRGGGSP